MIIQDCVGEINVAKYLLAYFGGPCKDFHRENDPMNWHIHRHD